MLENKMLRQLYNEISEKFIKKTLIFIFNISICSGTFPNLMKTAKVRPIHKKTRETTFPIIDQF
jgi:hypothetical protein